MRISFVPRYDRNAASSRLRVYVLAEGLRRLGHETCTDSSMSRTDVTVFQKTETSAITFGKGPTLYDFDDVWPITTLKWVSRAVNAFTTDTPTHALQVTHRCEVFPDPIDYDPIVPSAPAEPVWKLAWFGNYPCFESARPIFEGFTGNRITISDRRVSACGNLPWTYATFPRTLRSCGTAFLSHAGMDPGKSNNKLTAAVTLGVPVIAGKGSPSYEDLLTECGLEWAIVDSVEQLASVWYRLQFRDVRADYLRRIQPVVWERYRQEAVAKRFLEIVRSVL